MFGYQLLAAEALPENRERLRAVLADLKISSVIIDYLGGGDSGDVNEITVEPPELIPRLKTEFVNMRCLVGEWRDREYHYSLADKAMTLREALADFTLDWVNNTHGGWENNDGGQGTVTIDVVDDEFSLEHIEFFTESTSYAYAL